MAGISERPNILTFTVNFQGSRTVLHLPKDLKVGKAIQKAAEQFKTDPRGLTFLYHGLEITDDRTIGVSTRMHGTEIMRYRIFILCVLFGFP